MRKTYEFVSTDMDELDRLLVAGYEQFFGKTVMPGSPERLFISWVEDAIMYERAQNNWTGCQNLPSSAEGEYLDGLAELFYLQERPKPTAATCTMRFYISEPRQTAVLIPAGKGNLFISYETNHFLYSAAFNSAAFYGNRRMYLLWTDCRLFSSSCYNYHGIS